MSESSPKTPPPVAGIEPVDQNGRYPFVNFDLPVVINQRDLSFFMFVCRSKNTPHAKAVAEMVSFCLRLLADGDIKEGVSVTEDLFFKVAEVRSIIRRADLVLGGAEKVLLDSQAILAGTRHRLASELGPREDGSAGSKAPVSEPLQQSLDCPEA